MRTNVFLAALAGLLAVPTTLTILEERSSFTFYEDVPRLFEGFTPEKIRYVQLSKVKVDAEGEPVEGRDGNPEKETIVLQKTPDRWIVAQGAVQGAPVRSNFVAERVLAHMEAIRRDSDSLVASRADGDEGYDAKLKDLALTEESATLIQCFDAQRQPVAELYKGRSPKKSATDDSLVGFFVRRKDRDDVILYEEQNWPTILDAKQWVDTSIVPPTDFGRVTRIAVKNQQGEFAFRKTGAEAGGAGAWEAITKPEGAGAVRNQEVENLVSRAVRIRIVDYVQRLPPNPAQAQQLMTKHGIANPAVTAELEIEDGTIYKFAFGDKLTDKAEFFATVSSLGFVVTLPTYAFDSFEVSPDSLFDLSAEAAGGGQAQAAKEKAATEKADTEQGDKGDKDDEDDKK